MIVSRCRRYGPFTCFTLKIITIEWLTEVSNSSAGYLCKYSRSSYIKKRLKYLLAMLILLPTTAVSGEKKN